VLLNFLNNNQIEAGCDEAGRGCYAGPVVAAAVVLPSNFYHPLLNDSKQVSQKNRELLQHYIKSNCVAYSIAMVDNIEIDATNILKASIKAMHLAVDALEIVPSFLLIDGNKFIAYKTTPHKTIIKGDGIYASIAAASILAKTYRDELMQNLHKEYSNYGFDKNKGYGTLQHRLAIEKFGVCKYHRVSFNILPK
jgi:ribonuclease HII